MQIVKDRQLILVQMNEFSRTFTEWQTFYLRTGAFCIDCLWEGGGAT